MFLLVDCIILIVGFSLALVARRNESRLYERLLECKRDEIEFEYDTFVGSF